MSTSSGMWWLTPWEPKSKRRSYFGEIKGLLPNSDVIDDMLWLLEGPTDRTGLHVGNVYGHALNRNSTAFGIIALASFGAAMGRIPDYHGRFFPVGSPIQDRKGLSEYLVAAHRSPCRLTYGYPGCDPDRQKSLHNMFRHPNTVSHAQELFGKTDLVHRLVNEIDSAFERGTRGMKENLAESCTVAVENPRTDPIEIYGDLYLPRYRRRKELLIEGYEARRAHIRNHNALENARGNMGEIFEAAKGLLTANPEALEATESVLGTPHNPGRENTHFGDGAPPRDQLLNLETLGQILHGMAGEPAYADIKEAKMQLERLGKDEMRAT